MVGVQKEKNLFDRESLFKMLLNKEWDEIAKILFKNSTTFQSDPVIQQAIQFFELEFFADIEHLSLKDKLKILEYPGLVIELKQKSFSESFVNRFLDEKLTAMSALNSDALISFAASHQNRPLARKILQEIQAAKPELIADARRNNVTIKSTKTVASESKTIKLFKSRQEENFFEAIRKSFPTYHPYPNVALSCILNFDAISESLTQPQKDYFFRSVVDSVVFDATNGYKPMHFFEIDSSFHDSERARKNDAMKDAIFEAANTKLIRIRAHEMEETTVEKFQSLVLEVMRGL